MKWKGTTGKNELLDGQVEKIEMVFGLMIKAQITEIEKMMKGKNAQF